MSKILDNSVWPNGLKEDSEGYVVYYPLGINKKDISTITWPEGYKLVSPFVYDSNGKVVGFCDTKSLTVSGNTTTTMPYYHIEANFAAISEGKLTVNAPNATVKKFSWGATDSGNSGDTIVLGTKYINCKTVDEVKAIEPNYQTVDIVDGVWNESLENLENGFKMFYINGKLTSFTSDLSSLTNCEKMFYLCTGLRTFNADLRSLANGNQLLYCASNLITFISDLSSLTDGSNMFGYCSNFVSFEADLSSLTNGDGMFYNCKLDSASVKNIIDTINTVSSGKLTLGIGCDDGLSDKNLFAQEVGYANMTSLFAALQAKGWTVTAQYNGRPTSTFLMRRTTEESLPVFVKLEEVEESSDKLKSFHTHTSLDGNKKYRLNWFHETTGSTEGYTQFNSLEEAIEHFNVKPIERTR